MKYNFNLNIGCDYDGVLTNLFLYYKEYGELFFNKKLVNPEIYGLRGMFEISKYKEFLFGLKNFFDYSKNYPIREGMDKLLINLDHNGDDLYAITARKFVTKYGYLGNKSRRLCEEFADKYNINFKYFGYCSESNVVFEKLNYCLLLNVDIMIEDSPKIALELANNGIKVALIDAPYNQNIIHDNIRRCYNTNDVREYIEEVRIEKYYSKYSLEKI